MIDFPYVRVAIGAFAALLIVVLGLNGLYTVDQGERAVLTTNGALSGVQSPGLHFKLPIFQSAHYIDMRAQTIKWTCDPQGKSCPYGLGEAFQAYSRDQQPANISVSITYHIAEDQVAAIYSAYGTREALADRTISRKAPQEVKTVFGRYDAVTVIQQRAQFNKEVSDAVAASVDGPIIIDGVQVENIDFSDAYEKSVEQRMLAEVQVQQKTQELAQEKIKAQIVATTAQGAADALVAQATAQAKQTQLNGEAQANIVRLTGDAQAGVIKAQGEAIRSAGDTYVAYLQAQRWNGALPTTMVPNTTVPFLTMGK